MHHGKIMRQHVSPIFPKCFFLKNYPTEAEVFQSVLFLVFAEFSSSTVTTLNCDVTMKNAPLLASTSGTQSNVPVIHEKIERNIPGSIFFRRYKDR